MEAELGKLVDGPLDDGAGIDIVRFDFRELAQVGGRAVQDATDLIVGQSEILGESGAGDGFGPSRAIPSSPASGA